MAVLDCGRAHAPCSTAQGGIPMTLKAIFFLAVTLLLTVMLLSTVS